MSQKASIFGPVLSLIEYITLSTSFHSLAIETRHSKRNTAREGLYHNPLLNNFNIGYSSVSQSLLATSRPPASKSPTLLKMQNPGSCLRSKVSESLLTFPQNVSVYISPCHSLTSSQLTLPPPRVLKSILYICVFIPVLPLGSSEPFFFYIPYICVSIRYFR